MTIYAAVGANFEATTDGAPTGLVGTLGVRVTRDGSTVVARTTSGITEDPGEAGRYIATLTAPSLVDIYEVVFDTGGSDPVFASEPLVVSLLGQWPPDVDAVRSGSSILTEAFPSPGGDLGLQSRMIEVAAYVSSVTARAIFFPPGGQTAFGCAYEDVPPELQPLAIRAIRLALEVDQVSAGTREGVIEQREGGLASFSAGPYCVPLDTEALTPDGWKKHDEVRVGDLVLGYNADTGRSEWTPVLEVIRPVEAPLVRVGNKQWGFRCTANHRWIVRDRWMEDGVYQEGPWELREARELVGSRRWDLRTAAPADSPLRLLISPAEAAVIAWIWTDGHLERVKTAKRDSIRARITQKNHRDILEQALVGAGTAFTVTPYRERPEQAKYGIPSAWLRDLWERAELDHLSPSEFVLRLDQDQREAFLEAGIWAEGTNTRKSRGVTRGNGQGPWYRHDISQNPGPVLDAFVLAGFLSGYEPRTPRREDSGSGVRLCSNYHSGQTVRVEPAGTEPVWCVRTALGSWTIRQGRFISLTGNSESYFQPGSASSQGVSPELGLNSDPALSRALWGLLTECARSHWLNALDPSRPYAPAFSLDSVDWFPESHLFPPPGSSFSPDGW